jgi:hypothetical protein
MRKTEAFLVIGFIVSAALAIGFFMQKEEEKGSRIRAEKMLSLAMKEKESVTIRLNQKLQEKDKLITYISASLSKEKIINSKLSENLERAGKRLLASVPNKNPIELEKIIVSSLLEAEGKVLAVDKQNSLIVINLGSANNLKTGDKFSVYRGNNFIANAELVKVQDRFSAAMVLPGDNPGKDIAVEIDDIVK